MKAITDGKPITAEPLVKATAKPVKISPDPSVARIAGSPRAATSTPLNSPASAPSPSDTAVATANHSAASAPVAAGPAKVVRIRAATTAVQLAMPTTDKSIPPVNMVIVIAKARIANSGNWNAIEVMFCTDRKRSGERAAMITKTSRAMAARRASGEEVRLRRVIVRSYPPRGGAFGLPGGQAGSE